MCEVIENKKKCSNCLEDKVLCEFNKNKYAKDGHKSHCRECSSVYNKELLLKDDNRVKLKIKSIEWKQKNKKQNCLFQKKYKQLNEIENKEYLKNWRDSNKKNIKEYSKQYYNLNKAKKIEYNKVYNKLNPHIKAWRRLVDRTLLKFNNPKEGYTIDLLGYSALDLKNHIQLLFTEDMNWDNHGEWHIDHIKRLCEFDTNTDVSIVNALSNLRPLWATTREINGIIYEGNLNRG